MIKGKLETRQIHVTEEIICDVCQKSFLTEDINDIGEIAEVRSIRFTGGYNSVFGDGTEISCDICQHCFKRLVGPYCKTKSQDRV